MPTRKENISRIADGCSIAPWKDEKKVSVLFGDKYFAVYDIDGTRPRYRENFACHDRIAATNQFVIDGMRLAAQRVIDARKPKARMSTPFSDLISKALAGMARDGVAFVGLDPAKPNSEFTVRTRVHGFEPSWIVFDEATKLTAAGREKLGETTTEDKIASAARMTLAQLAETYLYEIGRAAAGGDDAGKHQDMADLIDDVACMRFGVGFYAPSV